MDGEHFGLDTDLEVGTNEVTPPMSLGTPAAIEMFAAGLLQIFYIISYFFHFDTFTPH